MATRKEKVSAGLFLLTGVLLLSALIALIAGMRLRRDYKEYRIRFTESVSGLNQGSEVVYMGVPVGSVGFIEKDVGEVLVHLKIETEFPIKAGTYATWNNNFLTGEATVELRGGDKEEESLPTGGEIPWRKTPLETVEESLPRTVDDIVELFHRLNDVLDQDNRDALRRIVRGVDELVGTAGADVRAMREEMTAFRVTLESLVATVEGEVQRVGQQVSGSVGRGVDSAVLAAGAIETASRQVEEMGSEVTTLARSLQDAASSVQATVEDVGGVVEDNRRQLHQTVSHLEASTAALERLLHELEDHPSLLLRGQARPERERGD